MGVRGRPGREAAEGGVSISQVTSVRILMMTSLDVGVLLFSATLPIGTSTLVSAVVSCRTAPGIS